MEGVGVTKSFQSLLPKVNQKFYLQRNWLSCISKEMGFETTSNIPKEVDQRWFDSCSSRIFVGSKREAQMSSSFLCEREPYYSILIFPSWSSDKEPYKEKNSRKNLSSCDWFLIVLSSYSSLHFRFIYSCGPPHAVKNTRGGVLPYMGYIGMCRALWRVWFSGSLL